jgi:hypothetical protein
MVIIAYLILPGLLFNSDGNCIRRISRDGSVSILAGNGRERRVDARAHEASFNKPCSCIYDRRHQRLLVAESGAVRSVCLTSGWTVTIAGQIPNHGIRDGLGQRARFGDISSIICDGNDNIFVIDNKYIRRIQPVIDQVVHELQLSCRQLQSFPSPLLRFIASFLPVPDSLSSNRLPLVSLARSDVAVG